MSRYLNEAGLVQRDFVMFMHWRNIEKARQDRVGNGMAGDSSMDIIALLYRMFLALNGLAIGIFLAEVTWTRVTQ